ncbi:hypothetical protein FQA39_LY13904 [Lamprigera yunnana]|nr:hypothetical protein FQA39_LY13904 [Lamprigera yunnana]
MHEFLILSDKGSIFEVKSYIGEKVVNLPLPVHGSVTARPPSSSRRDRLAVRNKATELVNKSGDEALCCEDMDVDEETELSVQEIEAANALMVLLGTNNSSNVPNTFNDFAVEVNTPSKLSFIHKYST